MKKLIMLFLPGLLLAGCGGEQTPTGWELSQPSAAGLYQAKLVCAKPPSVGEFQSCRLYLQSKNGVPDNLRIAIDGGMPAHGHGLPTSPVAVAGKNPGEFRIEGLQYSMPGEWLLGFLLQAPASQDKVVFKFTI